MKDRISDWVPDFKQFIFFSWVFFSLTFSDFFRVALHVQASFLSLFAWRAMGKEKLLVVKLGYGGQSQFSLMTRERSPLT